MSSLMAAPFEFAADVIPESVLGGAVRDVVEIGDPAEFREGQSAVQSTVLVEGPVQPAVGEHAPVAAAPAVRQPVERRGAIRAQAVVPARRLVQAVDRRDVIEKRGPQFLGRRVEAVQVRLLWLGRASCGAGWRRARRRRGRSAPAAGRGCGGSSISAPSGNRTSIDMQMRPSGPKSKTRTGWLIQRDAPVEEDDVHALQIREMIACGSRSAA